jgi:predicted PurR-regulated permease PerM
VLRVAGILAAVWLGLELLWIGRSVFLVAFLAVLFGLCISAGADRLARWRVPRSVAVIGIVLAVVGCFAGLGALVAPRIAEQTGVLRQQLPDAIDRVEGWLAARYGGLLQLVEPGGGPPGAAPPGGAPSGELRHRLVQQLGGIGGHFFAIFSSTLSVLGGLLLVLVVAVYVAVDPELYHRGLLHLFPHRVRPRAGEVLHELATMLRRWLGTQLIAMLVIGAVTTVVLLLLGVKGAIALGIIAGLLEFIPYVGPILSAVPAVAMGFLSGPEMALYVALAYLCIQQSENHLLIPLLMKHGIDLPPVLTIISQAVMGIVFGFLGLLVAMPLVGSAMVLIKMLYVEDVVGDDVALPGEA